MTWDEESEGVVPGDLEPPSTHRFAVYSVVLGIGAFACLYVFPFGCLALGVPSITTGVHARREIAASRGRLIGDQLAVTGLIIGGGALFTGLAAYLMGALG
ncbi:hypothetical protein [Aeromicrobium sp. UC242_57]|uniref:hypothetical protein n=1 Tax=Aeromicrobium sp. UC242_57 TaxID=3374624 RepID=UPI003790917B